MALSDAQICSIALLRVGQRQTIDSLNGASAEARICRAIYAHTRDIVLAGFDWSFARRRATLSLVGEALRTDWYYGYSLPADCVQARRLAYPGTRAPPEDMQVVFSVEEDATHGRLLVTDLEDAELIYTARITNTAMYPPLFVEALAWKLAVDLALALASKPSVSSQMMSGYMYALGMAASADAAQAQPDAEPESETIRVR